MDESVKLIRYEAARRALAECKTVDEAKDWADKAAALQAYGRMARDKTLEIDAAEIRIRAERRLGEMLVEHKKTTGMNRGGATKGVGRRGKNAVPARNRILDPPTLAQAGIDKKLSARSQTLAAVADADFEKGLGEWREKVNADGARVTAKLLAAGKAEQKRKKEAKKSKPSGYRIKRSEPQPPPDKADEFKPEDMPTQAEMLEEMKGEIEALQKQIASLLVEDRAEEILKLLRMKDFAGRRVSELMDLNARLEKKFAWWSKQLRRVGKAIGVDDTDNIAPTIEMMVRTGQLQPVSSSRLDGRHSAGPVQ